MAGVLENKMIAAKVENGHDASHVIFATQVIVEKSAQTIEHHVRLQNLRR